MENDFEAKKEFEKTISNCKESLLAFAKSQYYISICDFYDLPSKVVEILAFASKLALNSLPIRNVKIVAEDRKLIYYKIKV